MERQARVEGGRQEAIAASHVREWWFVPGKWWQRRWYEPNCRIDLTELGDGFMWWQKKDKYQQLLPNV